MFKVYPDAKYPPPINNSWHLAYRIRDNLKMQECRYATPSKHLPSCTYTSYVGTYKVLEHYTNIENESNCKIYCDREDLHV